MIDRQELIDRIEYSNNWNNLECPDWVMNIIKQEPDVEIRCRDCKYWHDKEKGYAEFPICQRNKPLVVTMNENDFCSYGVKK